MKLPWPEIMTDNVQSNAFKDYFAGHDDSGKDFYINGYFLTKDQALALYEGLELLKKGLGDADKL